MKHRSAPEEKCNYVFPRGPPGPACSSVGRVETMLAETMLLADLRALAARIGWCKRAACATRRILSWNETRTINQWPLILVPNMR